MESPLSFNSSENFRKKLLVRNLKPYRVDNSFVSEEKIDTREIKIVDYSVFDSPSVEKIGDEQEKKLYPLNKYGPTDTNSTYGNTIVINKNLNTESNQGVYGVSKTTNSKLYQIGNTQEGLLYVQNLYGPTQFNATYGNTVNINLNQQTNTNLGTYGYPNTIDSKLEQIGNQKEIDLIVKNTYKPTTPSNDFGNTVWFINDDLTIDTVGSGEYDVNDTFGSKLEQVGNQKEIDLIIKNIYRPENGTNDFGSTVWFINNDLTSGIINGGEYDITDTVGSRLEQVGNQQEIFLKIRNVYKPSGDDFGSPAYWINNDQVITTIGSGVYNIEDTIGSYLEQKGDQQEIALRVKNKYTPNTANGYGDTKWSINNDLIIGSNEGEYDVSDTIGDKLETDGVSYRNILFPVNQYGPEGQQSQSVVNPNVNLQTFSNEGNYDYNDTLGSPLEVFAENSLNFQINQYGPQGPVTNASDSNVNFNTAPFEGEYDYTDSIGSPLEVNATIEAKDAYVINRYVPNNGSYEPQTIDDLQIQTTGQQYYNSSQSFSFLPSEYLLATLLLPSDSLGSNGLLSQDSSLANIAAKQLRKEFRYRVAAELLSETVGRINALDSSIDPDSGEISVKPKLDPFNAVGIVSGNVPLLARNYKITGSNNIVGKAISFVAGLGGLYSPYSLIPGEFFDYPKKRYTSRLLENPIGATVGQAIESIAGLTQGNKSGSEILVTFTSPATRTLIFDQLAYNDYRPDYNTNNIFGVIKNLTVPQGKFYVGSKKNSINDIVSPVSYLPKYKGSEMQSPVFGYSEVAKDFEGEKLTDVYFGVNSRSFYDGDNSITSSFSWIANKSFFKAGRKVGQNGKQEYDDDTVFNADIKRNFQDSQSTKYEFRDLSLLDVTQKIVDASTKVKDAKRLMHVGNAISQVSKVFNDGYREMTKGSRVIKYVTKNSIGTNGKEFEGLEYCRIFTKDVPYLTYNQLQKSEGNIRKYGYSVFDNTYNLNITPMNDKNGQSTNLVVDESGKARAKKYMFSLENLAWRTSNKPNFTVDDLPACERGPNGGRIMWFPPYDLSFSDDSRATFQDNNFIGRPEPIYTYQNTNRTGSISWAIIVDHPSISNLLVDQELKNVKPESEVTKIMDSFFAGCLKYDLYELSKKYVQFTPNDIQQAINFVKTKEDIKKVVDDTPPQETEQTDETKEISDELNDKTKEYFAFYDQTIPNESGTESTSDYETYYNSYVGRENDYSTNAKDKIISYSTKKVNGTILNANFVEPTPKILPNDTADFDLKTYIDTRKSSVIDFFEKRVKTSKNNIDDFITKVGKILDSGGKVNFSLLGSANSNGGLDYNVKLSKRRINAVKKYILKSKPGEKKLEDYLGKTLIITKEDAQGDQATNLTDTELKNIDCSLKFVESNQEGYYSIQAMACRRTKIADIVITPAAKPPKDEKINDSQQPTGETNVTPPNVNNSPTEIKDTPIYQGLAKKLIRNLLTECNYFQMIQNDNPFIFDTFKKRFKNFQPVFHSITPEGLNSRLTFLQQCVRPGDTIPTITQNAAGTATPSYQDAFNSAFGSPPILVLRIGDFYHCKIVPESLTIKYDKAPLFDINPEGIGIQPMGATITLGFKIIGGMGLAAPIAKLQNALSFNYYANTEMYDERADVTEDVTKKYDSEFYEQAKINTKTDPQNNIDNAIGNTIGDIKNAVTTVNGNQTGTIAYETKMKELINLSTQYTTNIFNSLKSVNDKHLLGGLVIMNKEREYQEGYFNNINAPNADLVKIYGKSKNFQNRIDSLFSKIKDDIDDETIPILNSLNLQDQFTNIQKNKIKRKLKRIADQRKQAYVTDIDNSNNTIVQNELSLINLVDKLNFASDGKDGFINSKGNTVVYTTVGTTPVDVSNTTYPNTLLELRGDLLIVGNDLKDFISKLETLEIITTTTQKQYQDDFNFDLEIGTTFNREIRFNMVFGYDVVNNINSFLDDIVDVINNNQDKIAWKNYLASNLSWNPTTNQSTDDEGIYNVYKKQKQIVDKRFSDFSNTVLNKFTPTYRPYNESKTRILDFTKQIPVNSTDSQNLRNLTENSTNNKYNLKKKFN